MKVRRKLLLQAVERTYPAKVRNVTNRRCTLSRNTFSESQSRPKLIWCDQRVSSIPTINLALAINKQTKKGIKFSLLPRLKKSKHAKPLFKGKIHHKVSKTKSAMRNKKKETTRVANKLIEQ